MTARDERARSSRYNGAGLGQDAVTSGTRIGVHEIEAVIGEGGMGVVYRAHDTNLKRAVAIKVLSDELANAGARRRFQREAQTASSLNHPHIVAVHDAGEFDGRQYLVTELVDGGTLRDWMRDPRHGWRINEDGGDLRKVSLVPTLLPFGVSPGGEWIPAAEGPSPESRDC